MTTSIASELTFSASSSTFPRPISQAGSGTSRYWTKVSTTIARAVSANLSNSDRDDLISSSCERLPQLTKTARSNAFSPSIFSHPPQVFRQISTHHYTIFRTEKLTERTEREPPAPPLLPCEETANRRHAESSDPLGRHGGCLTGGQPDVGSLSPRYCGYIAR